MVCFFSTCQKLCNSFFRCILPFYDTTCFPVLSITNNYLLKAKEHYYYTLDCLERKKNKEIFFLFSRKIGFDISCKLYPLETVRMKCQILFYGKNKKFLINFAESAHSMVSNNSQMSVRNKKKSATKLCFS